MRLEQSSEEEQRLKYVEQAQRVPSQLALPSTYQTYQCNLCSELAEEPVVSECGHLFWSWPCIYDQKQCSICRRFFKNNEFVPIYTSHEQSQNKSQGRLIPPKPKAKHQQKIKNFSLGSNNNVPSYVHYRPNIQRGIIVAGNGFFPPTVINALGFQNHEVERQGREEEENIKTSLGRLTLVFLGIVCFLIVLS